MDQMLERASQKQDGEAFVRNSLEEGEGVEHRPYRSRTCDTLIKSKKHDVPPNPSKYCLVSFCLPAIGISYLGVPSSTG